MRALVVYDSAFGNTAEIGRAVAERLQDRYQTGVVRARQAGVIPLDDVDLVVIGSPTQGGKATTGVQEYIQNLPPLQGKRVAVFDTRFSSVGHGRGLRLLMRTIGFAAEKMAAAVTKRGGRVVGGPQGFIVSDKEGPLKEGELARAVDWAGRL